MRYLWWVRFPDFLKTFVVYAFAKSSIKSVCVFQSVSFLSENMDFTPVSSSKVWYCQWAWLLFLKAYSIAEDSRLWWFQIVLTPFFPNFHNGDCDNWKKIDLWSIHFWKGSMKILLWGLLAVILKGENGAVASPNSETCHSLRLHLRVEEEVLLQ